MCVIKLNLDRCPAVQAVLKQWMQNPQQRPQPLQLEEGSPEIQLNFATHGK
jgi:hypothetical protein